MLCVVRVLLSLRKLLLHHSRPFFYSIITQHRPQAITSTAVFSPTHNSHPPSLPPSLLSSALYYDGTERDCLLAVFSLDNTLLAIQRNRYWVEVRREGGREGGRKGRGWVGVSAHIAWLTLSASLFPIPISSVAFIPPSLPPLPPLPLGH